ncbi:MAG: carboxypeptidase regulatory-like domain-containing protein [Flavobacteriaceae bacterium]
MKTYSNYFFIVVLLALCYACSEDTISSNGTGQLKGVVIESGSNEPIENVKIKVVANNTTVLSDSNGEFSIGNIPSGEQSVSGEKDGYLATFEAITIISDSEVNLVLEMEVSTSTNNAPEQPNLLTPEDNAENLPNDVELTWESSDAEDDELTYTVEIRNDVDNEIMTYDELSETSLLLENLSYGVKYFWQVSVNDGVNPEVWSETHQFEINGNPNHRYLFSRKINGNEVVFSASINENETEELQLTSEAQNSWRPRKNRSNNLIAFLRSDGAETHLYSMNPDGTDVRQITNVVPVAGFNLDEIDFCWSDNGEKLLYPSFDKLYMINKDGSGLTLIYQTTDGSLISECDWTADGSMIAVKVNDLNGYNVSIYTIDMSGTILTTILSGVNGAAGGLNFSVDNNRLLYTHDASGFEGASYRQLDTHIYMYNFASGTSEDLSISKPDGYLDLDPRFSPNESLVIYTHTSNDGLSQQVIETVDAISSNNRNEIFTDAKMPDWE